MLQQYLPFTVLKPAVPSNTATIIAVATVLTVYGIETYCNNFILSGTFVLQQYLPFTVLKRLDTFICILVDGLLQQYLPFTVLKRFYYRDC